MQPVVEAPAPAIYNSSGTLGHVQHAIAQPPQSLGQQLASQQATSSTRNPAVAATPTAVTVAPSGLQAPAPPPFSNPAPAAHHPLQGVLAARSSIGMHCQDCLVPVPRVHPAPASIFLNSGIDSRTVLRAQIT